MKKTKKNQAGFTLIELAIIIAVLGILGAVGAVKFADMTKEAERAGVQAVMANARSALAIATVKHPGTVTTDNLVTYLDGATKVDATKVDVDGKYTVTFTADNNVLTNVATASLK